MQRPPQRPSAWKRLLFWGRRHPIWTAIIIIAIVIIGGVSNATSQSPATQSSATPTATIVQVLATPTELPTDTPTAILTAMPTPKPTPRPTPTPTPKPMAIHPTPTPAPVKPTPTHCVGIYNNPWCYDFNPGKTITIPPNGFCSYFPCIATFYAPDDPGDGYIVQCNDGLFSQSGGESGACSGHSGVGRTLYSH